MLEPILRNRLGGLQCPEAASVSSREWAPTLLQGQAAELVVIRDLPVGGI